MSYIKDNLAGAVQICTEMFLEKSSAKEMISEFNARSDEHKRCIESNSKGIRDLEEKTNSLDTKIVTNHKELSVKIDHVYDKLDTKIDNVYDKLDAKITALDTKIDNVYDKLDAKITALDTKIDNVYDKLDTKMDTMQGQMDTIQNQLVAILKKLDSK